jgi:heptosyltransferase-2
MKILIELPSWLGDAVMTSPSIENLINFFKNSEVTIVGSYVSIQVMKTHPMVISSIVSNKSYFSQIKLARDLGNFDYYFSFRDSYRSKVFKFFVNSDYKFHFDKNLYQNKHQVEKYNAFINDSLKINENPGDLKIYIEKIHSRKKIGKNPLLGINPGSSYGNAKRWYPDKFAKVILELSLQYDILILGGKNELEIAYDIEKELIDNNVSNYQNLTGKTSIEELKKVISSLDLFITGDSGPMHLAASFKIPTVSIFGPTKIQETSQWNNKNIIVSKSLKCQPCMKRKCPLKHHRCMSEITVEEVISATKSLT